MYNTCIEQAKFYQVFLSETWPQLNYWYLRAQTLIYEATVRKVLWIIPPDIYKPVLVQTILKQTLWTCWRNVIVKCTLVKPHRNRLAYYSLMKMGLYTYTLCTKCLNFNLLFGVTCATLKFYLNHRICTMMLTTMKGLKL